MILMASGSHFRRLKLTSSRGPAGFALLGGDELWIYGYEKFMFQEPGVFI